MKWFVIFLLLTALPLGAQEFTLEKEEEYNLEGDVFYGVDEYNATYTAVGNTLFKKGTAGDYQFTALQLGPISSVDLVNPLKITVFYEATNTAIILDNTLSEIRRINFSAIENFRNVSHASTANDRRLWIFNIDLQQLEIFDWNSNQIVVQFPPLQNNAQAMTSNFNFCWVRTPDALLTFNNYGSLVETFEMDSDLALAQSHGGVVAFAKAYLSYKPQDQPNFKKITLPDLTIKQLSLNNETLYIYDGQKVTSFRLKSPKK